MLSAFDRLFFKKYDLRRYNCLHFTIDVWRQLFGLDIGFLAGHFTLGENGLHVPDGLRRVAGLRRRHTPPTPGLCLFRTVSPDDLHIGTHLDGRVLHLTEEGVFHIPLHVAVLGFRSMIAYEYTDHNQQPVL